MNAKTYLASSDVKGGTLTYVITIPVGVCRLIPLPSVPRLDQTCLPVFGGKLGGIA